MLIAEFVALVYVPSRIELSAVYASSLHSVCSMFSGYIGHPARLEDLTESALCAFLAHYRGLGWSPRSTNDKRHILLSLWQEAADRGLVAAAPNRRRIRKLPEEHDPPEAWSESQVAALMQEAKRQRGYVGEVPASDWWLSLLSAIYWTSNRISAMLAVESRHYDGLGIMVRKQKNKRPQWFALPVSCRELIDRTRPATRELLWAHSWHPRTVWVRARRIIETAGLPCPRTGMQLFHRLRRTTITLCDCIDPAVAQRTAGHRDYETTRRFYVDPRLSRQRCAADILPDPLLAAEAPLLRIYG